MDSSENVKISNYEEEDDDDLINIFLHNQLANPPNRPEEEEEEEEGEDNEITFNFKDNDLYNNSEGNSSEITSFEIRHLGLKAYHKQR